MSSNPRPNIKAVGFELQRMLGDLSERIWGGGVGLEIRLNQVINEA